MQEQQLLDQMIALSGKKLELLGNLKSLSEEQIKAFQDKDLDGIERILNRKDEIIEYVQKLDQAFLATSENLKRLLGIESLEALSGTSLNGRHELKKMIEEITGIIEAVISLEKDSISSASALKDELGGKIKDVNAGKKLTSAYSLKPTSSPSYFFDKKK